MSTQQPKFIADYPIGKDLFEGKSQEKVAKNIISYIEENIDNKKRVVGIDGEWGSGKSNVIKIIEKETKKIFHIFTFDTWGHQEDLTRRTFLEELTDNLIQNNLLSDKWSVKIKEKLANSIVTTTRDLPDLNPKFLWLIFPLLLSPLIRKFSEYFFARLDIKNPGLFSYLVPMGIILLVIMWFWLTIKKEDDKPTLTQLFFLYRGQQTKKTKYETITRLEPSVREFRKILGEIVKELTSNKKLVFVFDNMDRLPGEKVKEIWSSIHTFFAEGDSNNIDSWAIIPYDEKHICKVFKENDKTSRNEELTISYIQKTFSIVFRIAPPILSDWKKYFNQKFKEAFNSSPPPNQQLANLFDYLNNEHTIKPRQIIDYINNLVAINKQWGDSIPLKYCGLFYLTKNTILKNPVEVIISRSFIDKVESIFAHDENLEKYISALVFNVDIEKADEVLLRRSIERTLRGEGKFDRLSSHPAFMTVLDSCFYGTELNVEYTILEFDSLQSELKTENSFEKYWNHLASEFGKTKMQFPKSEDAYMKLFENLSNNTIRIALLNKILNQITNYKENDKYIFRGKKYAKQIDGLNDFLTNTKIDIDVFDYCPKIDFNAEDFIEFVSSCNSNFNKYRVGCPENELNDWLIQKLPKELTPYKGFITETKEDFNYSALQNEIENLIKTLANNVPDFQESVECLYEVYPAIIDKKPFPVKIATANAWAILSANLNQPKKIDLALSILSDEANRQTYIANRNMVNILTITDDLEYAASIAEYHMTYEALIELTLSNNYPLLQGIVKSITYNRYGKTTLGIGTTISKYDMIINNIIKDDEEYKIKFLERLNGWSRFYPKALGSSDFIDVISVKFLKDCSLVDTDISKLTYEAANQYIISRDIDDWKEAFNNSADNFLFSILELVLANRKQSFKKLSDEALNAYKESILGFAENRTVPSSTVGNWDSLLDVFDARKLKTPYKAIRDKFIYNPDTVSTSVLSFFEKGLFLHGGLNERDKTEDVVRKLIMPALADSTGIKNVILRNKKTVISIIKRSKDHKDDVIDLFKSISDEEIRKELDLFSKELGFSL